MAYSYNMNEQNADKDSTDHNPNATLSSDSIDYWYNPFLNLYHSQSLPPPETLPSQAYPLETSNSTRSQYDTEIWEEIPNEGNVVTQTSAYSAAFDQSSSSMGNNNDQTCMPLLYLDG